MRVSRLVARCSGHEAPRLEQHPPCRRPHQAPLPAPARAREGEDEVSEIAPPLGQPIRPLRAGARNEVGNRYGRLTVVALGPMAGRRRLWLCRCDCGKVLSVRNSSLHEGNTRSCGCLVKDSRHVEHGATRGNEWTPEFRSWRAMIRRCEDPSVNGYKRYGGAGIKVCDRWRASFADFLADMGKKPSPKHTIDRKNGADGYHPGNCKWSTPKEQAANRKTTKRAVEVSQ